MGDSREFAQPLTGAGRSQPVAAAASAETSIGPQKTFSARSSSR